MKPVGIQRLAEQDIFEAIDYFVENAPNIVGRFQRAVDRTMQAIGRSPGIGSSGFAELLEIPRLRYQVVKSFPYAIFYQELDTEVVVLRVLHHGRDVMNLLGDSEPPGLGRRLSPS